MVRVEDKMKMINFFQVSMLCAFLASGAPAADAAQPVEFASPDQAAAALIAAHKEANKDAALLKVLGPEAADLIHSGDPVADKNAQQKFMEAYTAAHAWESDGADKEILLVGADKWPLPIPLVRNGDKWHFDTQAGRQEILSRRIGRNELNVINVCRAFVEAQEDYSKDYPGKHEYAQKFKSGAGKQDGLYWAAASGEKESPLGDLIASAEAEGYKGEHSPYHGYYYRILTSQSAAAHGGAKNYVVNGHMTAGFALLAFPAKYGDSGIKTFIVNQTGIVHEKDLGAHTAALATKITQYDPDATWQKP